MIASRLTRQLDVRLIASGAATETTLTLLPMETLPSYLLEQDEVVVIVLLTLSMECSPKPIQD